MRSDGLVHYADSSVVVLALAGQTIGIYRIERHNFS
jgi:Mn-dependent DtxR family transcriptional regulator